MQGANDTSPVLILGMHRSGTSCLAGCLEQAGLILGAVDRVGSPFNRKGNRENRAVMEFNDRVLARAGAAWDRPPHGEIRFTAEETAELRGLLAHYAAGAAWGLKDPRLLLLFEAWSGEIRPRLVGTFRHPAEVITSLMARAQAWGAPMNEARALALWRDYNERLLRIHQARPFPLLRYDQEPARYQAAVLRLAEMLGLPGTVEQSFFDATLRSKVAADAPIAGAVQALWDALLARAM